MTTEPDYLQPKLGVSHAEVLHRLQELLNSGKMIGIAFVAVVDLSDRECVTISAASSPDEEVSRDMVYELGVLHESLVSGDAEKNYHSN